MREWQAIVQDVGGGRTILEVPSRWNITGEQITVREVRKLTIEEIAEKFRRDVLPHISDIVNYDSNNQFEGYVFAYIMAHDGWHWGNARDVEFLSLFAFEALNTNVTEPRDFGHVKYLDEPTKCERHGYYSWLRCCPYCVGED